MLMIITRCIKAVVVKKGLVCMERDFSAMYDQTVTSKELGFFQGDISVSKQRYKIYQTE